MYEEKFAIFQFYLSNFAHFGTRNSVTSHISTNSYTPQLLINSNMICAACETRKHFECIDCMNNHKTHLCDCDCHDENTEPHPTGKSH